MNFYLSKNGQQLGPYSVEQIQIFLKQGLVAATDQVWAEGWPEWMPIGRVPGFAASNPADQPTYVPPRANQTPPQGYAEGKNPVLACGLSLLIVGTGQFYNGDWTKGWVMLTTCVIATICSFGTLWLFWSLFSAIDAYRVADRKKPLGAFFIPF